MIEQRNHSEGVVASRLQGFGTTIFSEMTALAIAHGAVNLGQGFPDEGPPTAVVDAAHAALDAGHHQYAPGPGVEVLRQAITEHQQRFYDLAYDPDREVTVTFGATEAVAATMLSLCEPGDGVVVLEPTYDAYTASISMAGAIEHRVPLTPPTGGSLDGTGVRWTLDLDRLADAIGPRTRLLLINSPHNPTGTVLDQAELEGIARLCVERDVIAVTDEVYEHLVYDGKHVPLAAFPGMKERTVTISSAGKTFSATGWKVGWACAPPRLTTAIRTAKQFLSFAGGTPLQHAIAHGLRLPDAIFDELRETYRRRRDLLEGGLNAAGLSVLGSAGAYFLIADVSPFGSRDADAFCRWAPEALGVAAVPVSAFVQDAATVASLVRFAFCKQDEVLTEATMRIHDAMVHWSTDTPNARR